MPSQSLPRGHTANLGAGQVNDLTLNGVAADYAVTIGPGPAIVGVALAGVPVLFAVNRLSVQVSNTTVAPGAPNLTITW